jgi:SM-20-related protein
VRDKIFAGHKLVRCYANAMCYGMDGTVHTDSGDPGNYTAVYYPHERWSPNWGGETIFYNREENRIMACFYPRPNSVVVFDGRIPHRASGVARSYAGLRITLMFKTCLGELNERPEGSR